MKNIIYDWKDIAKYFLYLSKQFDESREICELKMQKLLFFAYSDALYFLKRKLFANDIFAWKKGPAVRDAHIYFKKNFNFKKQNYPIPYSFIDDFDPNIIEKDKDIAILLKNTFDYYGGYTRDELSELTHKNYSWNANKPEEIKIKSKNKNKKNKTRKEYSKIQDKDILKDYELGIKKADELMKNDEEYQKLIQELLND